MVCGSVLPTSGAFLTFPLSSPTPGDARPISAVARGSYLKSFRSFCNKKIDVQQGIKAELNLDDSALESYYANAKFQSDCGDYVAAAAALKCYCDITQTPGVPGSGPNGMAALWGRLACEVGYSLS